jgi:hypothetical protein
MRMEDRPMTDQTRIQDKQSKQPSIDASENLFADAFLMMNKSLTENPKATRKIDVKDGTGELTINKTTKEVDCKIQFSNGDKLEIHMRPFEHGPVRSTFSYTLTKKDGTKFSAESSNGYELKFSKSKGTRTEFEGTYTRERGWEKGPGGNKPVPPHVGETFELRYPRWSKTTVQCDSGDSWTSSFVRGVEDRYDSWSWGAPGPKYDNFKDRVLLLRDTMDWTRKPDTSDKADQLLKRWANFDFNAVMRRK